MSKRFIWNRPHRPIGRPNWPNRPFFEWNQIFSSKSWKMTQIPARLCRPEVADAKNLGRKYVKLVPKVLLHTHNVQKYLVVMNPKAVYSSAERRAPRKIEQADCPEKIWKKILEDKQYYRPWVQFDYCQDCRQ